MHWTVVFMLLLPAVMTTEVAYTDIPKLIPLNSTITAKSQYSMSTFLPVNLTTTSSFLIDFSYSKITPSTGSLNCSYLNQTTLLYVTFTNCSCSNSVCTLAPGANFSQNYNLLISFGNLKNPSNVNDQIIAITVNISSTKYALVNTTISNQVYSTISLTVAGFQQSDYSVGATNVTYSFNFSAGSYVPQNAMLQITVPPEIGLSFTSYVCSFYGLSQTAFPTYLNSGTSSSLIFYFTNAVITNSTVISSLSIVGFINPKFIGSSSTFYMIINDISDPSCPTGCKVSQLNTSVVGNSTTSGDLPVSSMFVDNSVVNQICTVTLNLQLFAPIPVGGRLSIILPAGITAVLPVKCTNINGYTLTNSNPPTCTYDSATNNISTVNFAYPYLASTSTAVMSFSIVNPPDTSNYLFGFQTLDSIGRIIGLSRLGFTYSADPGTLTISAQRNDTTVDAYLKITFNVTFANSVTANGRLQILIPSEMANVTGTPVCLTTGGISLNSTGNWSTISPTIYNLSFIPVCNQGCTTNNSMVFSVTGLRNPSYINPTATDITVQSVSQNFKGIIDTNDITLNQLGLTIANGSVWNVSVTGSGVVGDQQIIRATFNISNYFQYNDGIITINLPLNSTFVYSTPQASVVTSNTTVPITISYTTYDQNMMSIAMLTLSGACVKTVCGPLLTILIRGISYSYSSLTYSPYNFSIATSNGSPIATGLITYPAVAPMPKQSILTLTATSQTTGSLSSYNFSFVPTIPIDNQGNGGQILLTLPTDFDLTKSSNSCSIITNVSLGFSLTCQLANRTVSIAYLNGSPQTLRGILISVMIGNVGNPQSSIPLNYSIMSYFNGAPSETFSILFQMTSLAQGNCTYIKTNNTYNTSSVLNLLPTFAFGVATTDSVSVYVPLGLFAFTNGFVTLTQSASNQVGTAVAVVVSNSTYTTITFTPLWNATTLNISLQVINPPSTLQMSPVQMITYRNSYASQKVTVTFAPCDPMTLTGTFASSVRTTGDFTNVTLTFNKNSNSVIGSVLLPLGGWDYSVALLPNGSALQNGSTISLVGNPNIFILRNLINKPDISSIPGTFTLTCLDNQNSPVEVMTISNDGLLANIPKAINASGVRSVTDSLVATNVTFSIANYNYQTNKTTMQIDLSSNQFWIGSIVNCSFTVSNTTVGYANLIQPCVVNAINNYSIITNHPCNVSKCSNATFQLNLSGVGNLYADNSSTNLTVLANGYTSQVSSFVVTPSIITPSLNNASVSLSTPIIATNSLLFLVFSSPLPIPQNSSIIVTFDDMIFLSNGDCTYLIGATSYSGCTFTQSAGGYVLSARLKSLGINTIAANTSFQIQLPMINSYAAYNISVSKVSAQVDSSTFTIGRFSISMRLVLGADTFTSTSLKNLTLSRNTTACGVPVTLNFSFNIPVSFYMSSVIGLMIPKDEVTGPSNNSNLLSTVNGSLQYISQDSSYYYYSLLQSVCQSNSCYSQTLSFSVTGFTNNNYPRYLPNSFMVGVTYNNTIVAPTQTVTIQGLQASQANISAARTIPGALKLTNISINIGITSPILTPTSITLSTLLSIFYGSITGAWTSTSSSNTALSYTSSLNGSYLNNVSITIPQLTQNTTLIIQTVNSPLVPLSGSQINITIYNSSMIFYSNNFVSIQNEITTYTQNLTLTRSVTTVASGYTLYVSGSFGLLNLTGYTLWVGITQAVCTGCTVGQIGTSFPLSSNVFNFSLTGLTNPQDIVDVAVACQVTSSMYTAYLSSVIIVPVLTPLQFTSQLALSTLVVNRLSNISITLSQISGTSINITIPQTLMSRLNACYYSGLKLTNCTTTSQSTTYLINCNNLSISTNSSNSLLVEVQLYSAVQSVLASVPLSVKYPYAISTASLNVTLTPQTLNMSVGTTSVHISDFSNVTVNISLLNVTGTYSQINLPFTLGQISIGNCTFITINSTAIRITAFSSTNLTLIAYNITNPYDNRPMTVSLLQISNSTLTLVGMGTNSYQMTDLGTITVLSAMRNSSNLNSPITINLGLNFDNVGSLLSITLLTSQVYYLGGLACSIGAVNQSCSNLANIINITGQWSGTQNITIIGYSNSKSSQKLSATDTMVLQLYNSEGYQVAVSKLQSYLIPEQITGNITVTNYVSSSQTILTPVDITFSFTLQDALTASSAIIIEQNTSYVLIPNNPIICIINKNSQSCLVNGNQTIITISDTSLLSGSLTISGLYNGIQPGPIVLRSVDVQHSADIDSLNLTNPITSYSPFPLSFRIIMSDNSLGNQNFLIVMDTMLPKLQDHIYKLQLTMQGTQTGSTWLTIDSNWTNQYSGSVVLPSSQFEQINLTNVQFTQQGDMTFTLMITASNISVAVGSALKTILSSQTNQCVNVDCDVCATTSTGSQQCIKCRENMVSNQGNCVSNCPDGTFSYNGVCQQCSAMCKTCFGPTSTQCLSCQPPTIDNSGFCTSAQNCTGRVDNGYCINNGGCLEGCKLCSPTQFCYQCMENYAGIGSCTRITSVPDTFFVYFTAPPLVLWLVLIILTAVKCQGLTSFLGVSIFSLALTEVFCNIMLIPLANSLALSIIVSSLLAIRIVVSVGSYQGYFKSFIYKDEQLLAKQLTSKDKLIGFFAHIICVDSYMLYLSKLGSPTMQRAMPFSKGVKIFNIVNMLIRLTLMVVCIYFLSLQRVGDYIYLPIVCISSQSLLGLFHILSNHYLFSKITSCISKVFSC